MTRRLQKLWKEEVAKAGLEKASLVRAIVRFQRTRLIVSAAAGVIAMVAAFLGPVNPNDSFVHPMEERGTLSPTHGLTLLPQAILVNKVLQYIEHPGTSSWSYGVGLAFALFFTEFCKSFFMSLMWAMNVRTAIRLKGAFCTMAYEKIISLRAQSDVSNGEVRTPEPATPTFV